MIVTEQLDEMIRHYSDSGKDIVQIETGTIYSDAIDKLPCLYSYEEIESVEEV